MAKKNSAPAYVSLSPNEEGRDFTISIIDGSIFKKLEETEFNEQTDRLIYNGEILSTCARPSVTLCTILNKRYFHAVRDQATASFLAICTNSGIYDYEGATDRGFNWVVNEGYSSSFGLGELATRLRQLPTLIDIQTPQGLVGFARRAIRSDMSWPQAAEEIKSGNLSVFDQPYCDDVVENTQGIVGVCIGEGYRVSQTGNVASVKSTLTDISKLFKVVSLMGKIKPAEPVARQELLPTTYRQSVPPVAAVA